MPGWLLASVLATVRLMDSQAPAFSMLSCCCCVAPSPHSCLAFPAVFRPRYYLEFFGNSTDMTLNWDPNMHMPLDTELVPMFPASHRQYMTRFMNLHELMVQGRNAFQFVPRKLVFFGHGTPMGVPLSFSGLLSPAAPVNEVRCMQA